MTEDNTVTVSGTTSGVENGQTVTVTLSDGVNPDVVTTATVTGGVWTAADADISGLNNGSITVHADVSDFAGNPAAQASHTLTLDNVAPSIAIDATLEGDNIVNASEDNTVTVSGTTSGVENGQTVTVTLSDGVNPDVVTTATVTGGVWTAADADISGLNNGSITVHADVSDFAGNPAAQASHTLTLDNVAPSIAIDATLEGDNIVNASEDNTVTVSGTTSGVENGQNRDGHVSDGVNPDVVTTATVTGGVWTAADADISGLNNGSITVHADVSDFAGNPAAQASHTLTLDNVAPSIAIDATLEGDNIVNASEDDTVTVSGTTSGVENGQTVTVTLSDGVNPDVVTTATVTGGVWTAADADISGLNNGSITVHADVSDFAGNPAAQASHTLTLDNVAPDVAITLSDDAITTGETATVTFTFSEVPTNFSIADVTYDTSNGSLTGPTQNFGIDLSGKTWTATFTPNPGVIDNGNTITVGTAWQELRWQCAN